MCKGWALQVVRRRPDTAGSPWCPYPAGMMDSPGENNDMSSLPGNVGARRHSDPGRAWRPRKEDPTHTGRVVTPTFDQTRGGLLKVSGFESQIGQ